MAVLCALGVTKASVSRGVSKGADEIAPVLNCVLTWVVMGALGSVDVLVGATDRVDYWVRDLVILVSGRPISACRPIARDAAPRQPLRGVKGGARMPAFCPATAGLAGAAPSAAGIIRVTGHPTSIVSVGVTAHAREPERATAAATGAPQRAPTPYAGAASSVPAYQAPAAETSPQVAPQIPMTTATSSVVSHRTHAHPGVGSVRPIGASRPITDLKHITACTRNGRPIYAL